MIAPEAARSQGCLHGVGLGPGDPDLLTVKAVKTIKSSPVIAFFAKKGQRGHARTIVESWLPPNCEQLPLEYPLTVEIPFGAAAYVSALSAFYTMSAETIADHLLIGRDVALLCEGDPLFYGSFIHIYMRLKDRFRIEICPGITGMSGCWTAAGAPITWGDDVLTVLPGTLCRDALVERLRATDAAVVMKIGGNFTKVRDAITAAGMIDRALYVERGTMVNQKIMPLADKRDATAPYFSMIIVPGQGRRP